MANVFLEKTLSMDMIYPVGAIYMSVNNTSPEVLFGGTWEKIENAFLFGASSSHALGEVGGEETHTLTIDEMPSHKHHLNYQNSTTGPSKICTYVGSPYWDRGQIEHVDEESYTNEIGGSKPHNNMPPYLVVNMWKRTA